MDVEIADYSSRFGEAFARLNREWLEKYFRVEPIDNEILSDPQTTIIDHGGVILYLLYKNDVIGTVALKHQGAGVYELTKMAVILEYQNKVWDANYCTQPSIVSPLWTAKCCILNLTAAWLPR